MLWPAGGINDGWGGADGDALRGVTDDVDPNGGQPGAKEAQAFCCCQADVKHAAMSVHGT